MSKLTVLEDIIAKWTKADKEAADIMTASAKEASTVKAAIETKAADLTKSVVDAYNNAG